MKKQNVQKGDHKKKNVNFKIIKTAYSNSTWEYNQLSKKKYINTDSLKSERHNNFKEEINETALSSNHDKIIHLIDSIEAYACGTSKDLVSQKEVMKCNI